jgi:hypothetical protein
MKKLAAVALIAMSISSIPAVAAGNDDRASSDRRICTQVATGRAGSRMSARRICRTSAQWREALGPDWRQHLAGARGLQDEYDAMAARMSPDGATHGQQPQAGGFGAGRAAGPR